VPQSQQLLDNDLGYSPSRHGKAKQLAQSYGITQAAFDRALTVLAYHSATGHKSLDKIKEELLSGAITDLGDITAQDVQTCIDLFGPCPHCLAGKMKSQKQMPNPIPDDALPGQHWEIDLMFTHFANSSQKHPIIIMVDLVTGYLVAIPLPSKGAADIDKAGLAFKRLLSAAFPKAMESQSISLYSDHERALNSMAAHVLGAKWKPRPIGDHANTVERYVGIIKERMEAQLHDLKIESGIELPGILYPKMVTNIVRLLNYEVKAGKSVSPNESLFGKKLSMQDAIKSKFGTVVMAKIPADKVTGPHAHVAMVAGCESESPSNLIVWDPATGYVKNRSKVVPIKVTDQIADLFNKHASKVTHGKESSPQPAIAATSALPQAALASSPSSPDDSNLTIADAIKLFGRQPTKDAVEEEMANLLADKSTRSKALVPTLPKDIDKSIPVLPSKGFIKAKYKNGVFYKLKYRLTAGGHRQKSGTYGRTSAPTIQIPNLLLQASLAKKKKLIMESVDIPGAYLHARLPRREWVYIRISKDLAELMVDIDDALFLYLFPDGTLLLLVIMALYGMRQAGSLWHDLFAEVLLSIGMIRSLVDAAIFYRIDGAKLQTANLHVDDLFHLCNCAAWAAELKAVLAKKFGSLAWESGELDYLSMHFVQKPDFSIEIDMAAMIKRIVSKAGVTHGAKTPSSADLFISMDDTAVDYSANIPEFRSKVASLIYLTIIRFDIIMETTHLATLVMNPGPMAMKKLDRVLRYLFATSEKKLYLGRDEAKLELFADSSYASHPLTMHSHGARIVRVSGGAIYAKSKEQKMVTTSSTEAELYELCEAVKSGYAFARLLVELGQQSTPTFTVYQDNQSTLHLAFNGEGYSGKAKHFKIRYHFIKEMLDGGELCLVYCPSTEMLADYLTKVLPHVVYYRLSDTTMGLLLPN
jgi:hypothetical protein